PPSGEQGSVTTAGVGAPAQEDQAVGSCLAGALGQALGDALRAVAVELGKVGPLVLGALGAEAGPARRGLPQRGPPPRPGRPSRPAARRLRSRCTRHRWPGPGREGTARASAGPGPGRPAWLRGWRGMGGAWSVRSSALSFRVEKPFNSILSGRQTADNANRLG